MNKLTAFVIALLLALPGYSAESGAALLPTETDRFFPFSPRHYEILSGQKDALQLAEQPGASALGASALLLTPSRVPAPIRVFLHAKRVIDPDRHQLAWWIKSRGASWMEVRLAIQEPDGEIRLHRAPSTGDSAWTRYESTFENDESTEFFRKGEPTAGDRRQLSGLVLTIPPFANGTYWFGEMELCGEGLVEDRQYRWNFQDVDPTIMRQMSFAGFQVNCGSSGSAPAIPLRLLPGGTKTGVRLQGVITTSDDQPVDRFNLPVATNARPEAMDLVLPRLPAGSYWVQLKQFSPEGELLQSLRASYLITQSAVRSLPTAQPASASAFWPQNARTILRIPAEKKQFDVPVAGLRKADAVTRRWISPWRKCVAQDVIPVTGEPTSLPMTIPAEATAATAWQLELELRRNGTLLDAASATVLLEGQTPALNAAVPPAHEEAILPLEETEAVSVEQEELKLGFVRHLSSTGSLWAATILWDELEPERGFLQYPLIDRVLAAAQKQNVPVVLTLFLHQDRLPQWLWYDTMLEQNGGTRNYSASFIRKPSPCSERTWSALRQTVRTLVEHYKNDPRIVGWNFSQGVESFWSDAARNRLVVDYSSHARTAFTNWLQKKGYQPGDFRAENGQPFADWNSLTQPLPVFDGKLDRRPLWLAWEDFKQDYPLYYFDELFRAVREGDQNRMLKNYAGMGLGDLNCILPVFRKHNAAVCFGAGESPVHALLQSLCRQADVRLTGESSAVPPRLPTQLYTLFLTLAFGKLEGGNNIMWGRFVNLPDAPGGYADASSESIRIAAQIRATGATELLAPSVAVGMGMRSIINQSRSFMWPDWCATNSFGFLDALNAGVASGTGFVTENNTPQELARYRAVVLTPSPILSTANASKLAAYVRSGGILVLTGQSGMYNEKGEDDNTLQTLLELPAAPEGLQPCGKGAVLQLPKPLDWKREFVPLLKTLNCQPAITSSNPRVPCAVRRNPHEPGVRYLFLFAKSWDSGNPASSELGATPLTAQIRLAAEAPGRGLHIQRVDRPQDMGSFTAQQLEQGMAVTLKPAELQIFRLQDME